MIIKRFFLLVFLFPSLLFAQEYYVDEGFAPGTGLTIGLSGLSVELQSTGNIIVAGDIISYDGTAYEEIVRVLSDGNDDTGFTLDATIGLTQITAMDIESDDNIIVGGPTSGASKIARINGTTGTAIDVFTDPGFDITVIKSLSSGKVIAAGSGTTGGIVMYNSDGTIDGTFTSTGFTPYSFSEFLIHDIDEQADGKIVIAGYFEKYNGVTAPLLVRINTDGTLDNTFSYDHTQLGDSDAYVGDVEVQSDGNIVISSRYRAFQEGSINIDTKHIIQRITSTGANGDFVLDLGLSSDVAEGMAIDSNGDIWVSTTYIGKRLLRVDGTTGQEKPYNDGVDNDQIPFKYAGNYIHDLAINGNDEIFIVGDINVFDGYSVPKIAKISACPDISLTAQPADDPSYTWCEGDNRSMSITTAYSGGGTLTYQWQKLNGSIFEDLADGGIYSGTATDELVFTGVTATEDLAKYRCIISDGTCRVNTAGKEIKVTATTTIDSQPVDVTLCNDPGVLTQLAVVDFGIDAGSFVSVTWQVDDGSGTFVDITDESTYSNINGEALQVKASTALNGYKYRAVERTCNTELISDAITLTVNEDPEITTQPVDKTICGTGTVSYTVEATGTATPTYQWQYYDGSNYQDLADGGVYSGVTTNTLTLTDADNTIPQYQGGAVHFRCAVSVAGGCETNSESALLWFITQPTISQQPITENFCYTTGGSTYTASFTVETQNSQPGMVFQWQVDEGGGSGFVDVPDDATYDNPTSKSLSIPAATESMSGYKFRVKVGNCATDVISDAAELLITPQPTLSTLSNVEICEGSDVNYTIEVTGAANPVYQWMVNSGSGFVEITDNTTYSGATTNSLTLSGVQTSQDMDRFRLNILEGGCNINSNSSTLRVYATPVFTSEPGDNNVCEGESIIFRSSVNTSNLNVFSFQWQEAAAGTDVFEDIVEGNGFTGVNGTQLTINPAELSRGGNKYRMVIRGCTEEVVSAAGTLTVDELPAITVGPQPQAVCEGTEASFSAEATGDLAGFEWHISSDGTNFSETTIGKVTTDGNTSVFTLPTVIGHDGLQVKAVAVGTQICTLQSSESEAATLTVNQTSITSDPSAGQTFIYCEGEDHTISIEASGKNLTYQWYENGTAITDGGVYSGATTNTLLITGLDVDFNGNTYYCMVSGDCDPVQSQDSYVVINYIDKPVITGNFSEPTQPILTVTSSYASVIEWFKDETALNQSGFQLEVSQEGVYKAVGYNGECSAESDPFSVIITDIIPLSLRDISVYPNPVNKIFSLNGNIKTGSELRLLNMNGTLIQSFIISDDRKTFGIGELKSGNYLLRIKEENQSRIFKIIKQ